MTQPTEALAPTERTQFDYLLNAFEAASQSDKPAEHGYGDKRRKLYAYVRDLERRTSPVQADAREAFEAATRETIPPMGQAGIAQWWFSKGLQAGRASRAQEAPAPEGYEKMRGGKPVSFWRDDALEQAAQIAERYGADPWAARDIRAMKSPLPAAPEQQLHPRLKSTPYGPAILLDDVICADRYRKLRTMLIGRRSPVAFSDVIIESAEALDEIVDAAPKEPQK